MYLYARVYMRIPVYTSSFGSMNSGVRTSARGFGDKTGLVFLALGRATYFLEG